MTTPRNALLALPLILINISALYGQTAWTADNLTHSLLWALVLAGALESVGIYLAIEAHRARLAGDAALRLRLGSYGVAAMVGAGNYLHWAAHGTLAAVTFGLMSASSPWLWAIRSRSLRREQLRAAGMIDPHAVRFSLARWLLFPRRTFEAFRAAVWEGETDPARAIALASPCSCAPHVTAQAVPMRTPAPASASVRSALTPTPELPPSIPPAEPEPTPVTAELATATALPMAPASSVSLPDMPAAPPCPRHPHTPTQWAWPSLG
jgi:Protein of unknown function (DUF2637)